MTVAGQHIYVLVQEATQWTETAIVRLFADALDAVISAQQLCDGTRTRVLTPEDTGDGVVFRGFTRANGVVTVRRQLIA